MKLPSLAPVWSFIMQVQKDTTREDYWVWATTAKGQFSYKAA